MMTITSYEISKVPSYNKYIYEKTETTKPFVKLTENIKGDIDAIETHLKNNAEFHERLHINDLLKLTIDLDKITDTNPTATLTSIFSDIKTFLKVEDADIKYTTNSSIPSGSHHVVIPKFYMKTEDQKILWEDFKKKFSYKKEIDTSIFGCEKWFRLPNQKKEGKAATEHIIQQGEIRDFVLKYIPDDCIEFKYVKEAPKIKEKKEKAPPKAATTKKTNKVIVSEDNTDDELESVDSQREEKTKEKCETITKIVNAILETDATYFDDYNKWTQLGFLIYNECTGDENGAELFIELSKKFQSDSGIKQSASKVAAQYHKTQDNRKKESKLFLPSLYLWLQEVAPDHELVTISKTIKLETGQLFAFEVRETKEYKTYRDIFEKTNFKLNHPLSYIEIDNKKNLLFSDRQKFSEKNRDIKDMPRFLVKTTGNKIPLPFSELWLDDCEKRKYNNIIFDPSRKNIKNEESYNTFCGFINEDDSVENIKEENSDFIKLMKWLFVEDKVFEYVKSWIAHIIQHPEVKTKVALILYSKTHGSGKNSVIDGIIAILGSLLCSVVESIEDITKNFNAHHCNKLFIYGDEINANAKKVADRLKQVITRPTQMLEKKNVDSMQVDDYTNWAFTTNNENCFKAEEGCRRLAMIRCREEKQNNLSTLSYAEIGDKIRIKQLFKFFKNYQQSSESIELYGKFNIGYDNVIPTEYKKEMLYENKPAYIQMFFKNTFYFVRKNIRSIDLYKESQKYAKLNYLTCNYTHQEMAKSGKYIIDKFAKRRNSGMKYVFPETQNELLQHLYEMDEKYYRYVFNLDDDYTPTFEPKQDETDYLGNEIIDNK